MRVIDENTLYKNLPRDEHGRIVKQCRSCSKTHDYISRFSAAVFAKKRGLTRRKVQRIWSICYLGGACQKCKLKYNGSNAFVFDFHHRDPSLKEFTMSQRRYSFERLQKELDKCDLLCGLCHRAEHSEAY